jgi:KaiC/GvpD/RAD55 family RecA-like ATPase
MFRNTLPGMELVFHTDPPAGSIITLVGGAGTLKSALTYAILASRLDKHPEERAMYVTLEETKDGHLANLGSLGLKVHPRIAISDVASFRAELQALGTGVLRDEDYLSLLLKRAQGEEGGKPYDYLVVDSLNALEAALPMETRAVRRVLQDFFFTLRARKITTIALIETTQIDDRPEYFLVDGIIELGVMRHNNDFKRYLTVRKMRACRHEMRPFILDVTPQGIRIMGEVID